MFWSDHSDTSDIEIISDGESTSEIGKEDSEGREGSYQRIVKDIVKSYSRGHISPIPESVSCGWTGTSGGFTGMDGGSMDAENRTPSISRDEFIRRIRAVVSGSTREAKLCSRVRVSKGLEIDKAALVEFNNKGSNSIFKLCAEHDGHFHFVHDCKLGKLEGNIGRLSLILLFN